MQRRLMPGVLLALIVFLTAIIFALSGCGNKEEKPEPGYYTGKDFKAKGGSNAVNKGKID